MMAAASPAIVPNGPTFAGFDATRFPGSIVYHGPCGRTYVFDAALAATQFKLCHGDLVVCRKGPLQGQPLVVLGVSEGLLWLHSTTAGVAVALRGCASFGDIADRCDLQKAPMPAGSETFEGPLGHWYVLATAPAAVAQAFGVAPGERYFVVSERANCTVVGAALGVVWVARDADTAAAGVVAAAAGASRRVVTPLVGATSASSLRALHGLAAPLDPHAPIPKTVLPAPVSAAGAAASLAAAATAAPLPFAFDARSQTARCVGPFGAVFDVSTAKAALAPFNVAVGQRLKATRGPTEGAVSTVVGVHSGALWVHTDGERHVSCCRFCAKAADLLGKAAPRFAFVPATGAAAGAASPLFPAKCLADAPRLTGAALAPASPVKPPAARAASAAPSTAGAKASGAPFVCWSVFGRVVVDASPAACGAFGFAHGEAILAQAGPDCGRTFVVAGVRGGVLWVAEEGAGETVRPLRHCADQRAATVRFGFAVTGRRDTAFLSQQPRPRPQPLAPVAAANGASSATAPGSPWSPGHRPSGDSPSAVTPREAPPPPNTPATAFRFASTPPGSPAATSTPQKSASPATNGVFSPPAATTAATADAPAGSAARGPAPVLAGTARPYLKAVALHQTGAQSSAEDPLRFHSFFMTNTAHRLSHALSRYAAFERAWADHHADAGHGLAGATPDEMLAVLRMRPEVLV